MPSKSGLLSKDMPCEICGKLVRIPPNRQQTFREVRFVLEGAIEHLVDLEKKRDAA